MNVCKEKGYAKINLYLNILSRADDGFHEIKTVMHTVSLADDITVSVKPSGAISARILFQNASFLPTDRKNLAVEAAYRFLEYTGNTGDVEIKLQKNIPVAAGLAGGSSDAAAVFRAMNKLYRKPLTESALCGLSSSLGSDIPYCVKGGTVLCEGRGEKMTELGGKLHLYTVIAIGNEHLSTPKAYGFLDERYSSFDGSVPSGECGEYERLLSHIQNGTLPKDGLFNIFESAVLPKYPAANEIRGLMLSLGAKASLMSGSGPSVYGLFEDEITAKKAEAALLEKRIKAFYAETAERNAWNR